MNNLRIVNLRHYTKENNEVLILANRSTVLGNPFAMLDNSIIERDRVCDLYSDYFKIMTDSSLTNYKRYTYIGEYANRREEFMRALRGIKRSLKQYNVALGCTCIPHRCHVMTIVDYILNTELEDIL